jgi:EAL domain-containing protein (putative c-di-GMP-specific phosphodiesterase class I)
MADIPEPDKNITDRLMAALHEDEFLLYAQAIVPLDPNPGERQFQELFVRFQEEDDKLMPPGSFLPILQEHSLLPYLDRWVVSRLARWVRTALHIKPDWKVPRSNVNLSAETLLDTEFADHVRRYVEHSVLSDGALGFEIDWDSAIEHHKALRRLMAALRPHGCCFTLADFDGSKESFDSLKSLAPDYVKSSSASVSPEKAAEINRMCRSVGCKTIIEHVETAHVLEQLRQRKVDFAQGFEVAPVQAL